MHALVEELGAENAINLDGGGSTTLVLDDGVARDLNVPVGIGGVVGTDRPVANALMLFALRPVPEPSSYALLMVGAGGVTILTGRRKSGTRAA